MTLPCTSGAAGRRNRMPKTRKPETGNQKPETRNQKPEKTQTKRRGVDLKRAAWSAAPAVGPWGSWTAVITHCTALHCTARHCSARAQHQHGNGSLKKTQKKTPKKAEMRSCIFLPSSFPCTRRPPWWCCRCAVLWLKESVGVEARVCVCVC